MNIQRLKFAHARGAVIQYKGDRRHSDKEATWYTAQSYNGIICDDQWRIHPDDEHLQYGPLSSECLELAKYTRKESDSLDFGTTPLEWAAREFSIVFAEDMIDPEGLTAVDFEDFWDLWLGFVAEYLADQGM